MTPVPELQDLHILLCTHRHQGVELVKGAFFLIYPGECPGVLGESRNGKSTSMKAAMGLLDHSFHMLGSVKFQGEGLLGRSDEGLRRLRGGQVGIILQNPMTCFDPLYRIGAQIAETFTVYNDWSKVDIRQRSLEMLEKMRIRNPERVLEKYLHQLSGGMLRRITTDIAISMKPFFLIADESTIAIDAITQFEILDELLRIKQEHQTVMIFISRDLNAISRVVDRTIALNQGFAVDQGDFQYILRHATDSYIKLLVEKRMDVMCRYSQALGGKECVYV